MKRRDLVRRGVVYYWRTNAAVVLGIATAVAVLAGALLVGDSVRGSLRDLVLERIGRTDSAIVSTGFFREALGDELAREGTLAGAAPLIAVEGTVSEQAAGRRASRVLVYGVDDRFWRFHGVAGVRGPSGRDALVSQALAADLGAAADSSVLVRIERPSAIPIESLHGRKEDAGRTLRLTVRAIVGSAELGDFSLRPQQGAVRAVFVPLARIQQDLGLNGRVNTLLVSGSSRAGASSLDAIVRERFALQDVGLKTRVVGGGVAVESAAGLIDEPRAKAIDAAARKSGIQGQPILTYLANTIRSGDRQVPYSLVAAMDLRALGAAAEPAPPAPQAGAELARPPAPIILNEWTARELAVKPGDPLTLEYFVWEDPGRLVTRSADFTVAAIVPIAGAAADRDLAPVYPGITEAATLSDWDPPFPIDLKRIRKLDEQYWEQYRTTPKAFVPIEVGQSLWRSRYGDRTSVRLRTPEGTSPNQTAERFAAALRTEIDPLSAGLAVVDVRTAGLAASRGATDFGEYFTYFSFFLVAAALLLAVLFFRLAVEQRAREVGLLRAVGFSMPRVRRLFAAEGFVLAAAGSAIGAVGAVGYAAAMMHALRTWWVSAVATTSLTLHVSPLSIAAGVIGALAAAMACIWWTLRSLAKMSERTLLAGDVGAGAAGGAGRAGRVPVSAATAGAIAFAVLGVGMMIASAVGAIDQTGGFFGAGTAILAACLCAAAATLRVPPRSLIRGRGWPAIARLGLRNAAHRPGRSVLAIGVIASAAFILISVDAFQKDAPSATDRHSGVGGYALLVNLLMPIAHDPNSRDGRDAIGLSALAEQIAIEPFRVRRGDDASCLNLYQPRDPRIFGVRRSFIDAGRFAFQGSIAATDAERANPWLLLNGSTAGADDAVPVVADANSMSYVLHKSLGDDIVIDRGGRPLRLRLVAALADSIFQGELLMSDENFRRVFPDEEGYRFLLIEAPADRAAVVAAAIEQGAGDLGADAVPAVERLAEFHAVENTYLSTFKTLGGLGLLVGTIGLAAVLLRNVLERRRELALLGAAGYRRGHIFAMVLAENVLLLGCGLAVGALSAAVAIAPVALERGGRLPAAASAAGLVIAVFAGGLVSSLIATRTALGAPLLEALRSE